MKNHRINYYISGAGLLLLGAGLFWIKTLSDPQGVMRALPYIFIGIGCGGFGHGMGNIINFRALKNNPDAAKQIEIEKTDERNIAIGNRAKAKAYDMMIFVFGALMLSFALMQIDITAVLLLVIAYLFVIGYSIYYRSKYEKEM
ncbi:DUF6442 family protein [Anaerocolumna xylanovorans]|uniref:DUF2178 domain-containing protein n=1 Tax=Anaerocolumna xylanovorans DSM 12503 TaxID=1121345 RepID=A0A1M7YG14_9FIRM|nr:DUF6442 family protein [Anaerocolumna xylanovorans]SHO51584.1 hypothetical protein SAMN02745217_03269 [Anaerocolumna xylanovorans DSM 12503]